MEDDLNLKVNIRRPQFEANGRRPQFESKWKTTTGKAGLASPIFSWAWHSSAPACQSPFNTRTFNIAKFSLKLSWVNYIISVPIIRPDLTWPDLNLKSWQWSLLCKTCNTSWAESRWKTTSIFPEKGRQFSMFLNVVKLQPELGTA
jgi:hypothetical protein